MARPVDAPAAAALRAMVRHVGVPSWGGICWRIKNCYNNLIKILYILIENILTNQSCGPSQFCASNCPPAVPTGSAESCLACWCSATTAPSHRSVAGSCGKNFFVKFKYCQNWYLIVQKDHLNKAWLCTHFLINFKNWYFIIQQNWIIYSPTFWLTINLIIFKN
jgi:hypothetical protein